MGQPALRYGKALAALWRLLVGAATAASDHKQLARLFTGKFGQVANRLTELRQMRNKADYEENPPVQWEPASEAALRDAKKIVEALKLT